jgi:hypothetical protein
MGQRLKRWESPRCEGRNKKGRGGSARLRQKQKQCKQLIQKLKNQTSQDQASEDQVNKNQTSQNQTRKDRANDNQGRCPGRTKNKGWTRRVQPLFLRQRFLKQTFLRQTSESTTSAKYSYREIGINQRSPALTAQLIRHRCSNQFHEFEHQPG